MNIINIIFFKYNLHPPLKLPINIEIPIPAFTSTGFCPRYTSPEIVRDDSP